MILIISGATIKVTPMHRIPNPTWKIAEVEFAAKMVNPCQIETIPATHTPTPAQTIPIIKANKATNAAIQSGNKQIIRTMPTILLPPLPVS